MGVWIFSFAQTEILIHLEAEDIPLVDVFQQLEKEYEISFSYNPELIEEYRVTTKLIREPLEHALEIILNPFPLKYELVEQEYILISKDDKKIPTNPNVLSLCGKVYDALTKEPLEFANVFIANSNLGVATNGKGAFNIQGNFDLTDSIEVRFLSYKTQQFLVKEYQGEPCFDVYLELEEYESTPIVVTDYLLDGMYLRNNSDEVKIQPDKMNVLPGQAEPDVLYTVQLLPGVNSPDESASKIHIRGGTPDQNLILYDGIPMYHSGHFFGSISAFNPYVVEEINVWRGGYGAEYGGRVSGVVDIKSQGDIPEKIKGGVGLNFTHTDAHAIIPFFENKSALMFSFRRSITDVWESPTFAQLKNKVFQGTKINDNAEEEEEEENEIELDSKFNFYDAHLKWLLEPTSKDKIFVSFFSGNNNLDYSVENSVDELDVADQLRLKNWGISGSWKRNWNEKWSSEWLGSYSHFNYVYRLAIENDSIETNLENTTKTNTISDWRIQWMHQYLIQDHHTIKGGVLWNALKIGFDIDEVYLFEDNFENEESVQGNITTGFLDYSFQKKKIFLHLGLRYNRYQNHYWEPRFSLHYQALKSLKFKLHGGINHQFVSQLVELDFNNLGINNEIWVLSDKNDPIIQGQQIAAGFIYIKNGWQIDVEGYLKRLNNITSLSTSFGTLANDNFSTGKSEIWGIDILLKKRWKKYRTWASYTYGVANYSFPEISSKSFPSFHDLRHQFQWIHMYKMKNMEFSLGWSFHSGLPYTPLQSETTRIVLDDNEEYIYSDPVLGEINSARLDKYHRLDFSYMYTYTPIKVDHWKIKMGCSINNIYNRNNIFSNTYQQNIQEEDAEEISVLEIEKRLLKFSPNVMLRFEWR